MRASIPSTSMAPLALLLPFLISPDAPAADDGLVGHWTFDEVVDRRVPSALGNGLDGALVNGPELVEGVQGRALSFAGRDAKLEVPHTAAIDLGKEGGSYAVSFWFRSSVLPGKIPDAHLITKFGDPYPFSFVQIANGLVQFRTYDSKVCSTIDSGLDISDGNWHFVAGMRDGRRRRLMLYVDGLLVSTGSDDTEGDLNNDGPLFVGRSHGDDFSGALDELRIYSRLLTKDEISRHYRRHRGRVRAAQPTGDRPVPKRAPGRPVMRERMENWQPTQGKGSRTDCRSGPKGVVLANNRLEAVVSAKTGEITSLETKGHSLLRQPAGVIVRDALEGTEFGQDQGVVVDVKASDDSPGAASVIVRKKLGDDYLATITYTLGARSLCCDVRLETSLPSPRESRIEFSVPALSGMTKALWPRDGAPFDLADLPAERIAYRQWNFRTAMILPFLTVYNPAKDVGVGFVAPFDLPKPGLCFEVDAQEGRLGIVNNYLRLSRGEPARAAVYIVPHEGCWRPSLAWMLKTYPEYFRPGTKDGIETPGWYWLGGPLEERPRLEALQQDGCRWFQIHGHFPFYGMYMPKTEAWEVVVGLADQGKANLSDWESGKAQGGYRNSYDQMREAIRLRQECGMQAFLYFQSFELWDQYAAKHFADDVARHRGGTPLSAWHHCNLMNPDPAFPWGQHIAAQIERVPEAYPSLDGIFYDRDDYRDYDYAHDDGVTMVGTTPCYMLGFAQQQINERVTAVTRKHRMGVWTNGPTSIEVCKYIDGIMSEAGPQAHCHQYLGLARPVVLLPYFHKTNSYDTEPDETEEKLKTALSRGFFPSLTYGGEACKALDRRFVPLFALLRDREWVLEPHALILGEGLTGNIFRSPEGRYIVTVVDMGKSQLAADAPTRNVHVEITVPDAGVLKHGYVLSGDYAGPNVVDLSRDGSTVETDIPLHRACSVVVFSETPMFEVARRSDPLFVKGRENVLSLDLYNPLAAATEGPLKVASKWFEETEEARIEPGEVRRVSVEVDVPAAIPQEDREITFHVAFGGRIHRMSAMLSD